MNDLVGEECGLYPGAAVSGRLAAGHQQHNVSGVPQVGLQSGQKLVFLLNCLLVAVDL